MSRAARILAVAAGLWAGAAMLAAPLPALAAQGGGTGQAAASGGGKAAQGKAAQTVIMRGSAFEPARLEVHPGDKVVFKNNDVVPHDVKGPGFDSGVIKPGASYTWVAKGKGEIAYRCTLHPKMDGTLVVGAGG